jgi:hypothetical protein
MPFCHPVLEEGSAPSSASWPARCASWTNAVPTIGPTRPAGDGRHVQRRFDGSTSPENEEAHSRPDDYSAQELAMDRIARNVSRSSCSMPWLLILTMTVSVRVLT